MCNLYDVGPRRQQRGGVGWDDMVADYLECLEKDCGIRKTDPGPVMLHDPDGQITISTMRWGFARHFNPAINNARGDKLGGMWRPAWEARRCLVPVRTFYEWTGKKGSKQTHAFQAGDGGVYLYVAGLWEKNRDPEIGNCFTMVTCDASEQVAPIHDRMPAILDAEAGRVYLDADDPVDLIRPWQGELRIFSCANPLRDPVGHRGPVPVSDPALPGFE